jgi:hypothetical protein
MGQIRLITPEQVSISNAQHGEWRAHDGMTFWLTQRATAVLTPAAVTAYSYLMPFASMLLLLIGQPQRMGRHWLPGSLLVVLAIALLLKRDAVNRRPKQHTQSLQLRPAGQVAECFSGA